MLGDANLRNIVGFTKERSWTRGTAPTSKREQRFNTLTMTEEKHDKYDEALRSRQNARTETVGIETGESIHKQLHHHDDTFAQITVDAQGAPQLITPTPPQPRLKRRFSRVRQFP